MNGQSSRIITSVATGAGLTRGTSMIGHGQAAPHDFVDAETKYRTERLLVAVEQERFRRDLRRRHRELRRERQELRRQHRNARALARIHRQAHKQTRVMSGWTAWLSLIPLHRSSVEPQSSSVCGS